MTVSESVEDSKGNQRRRASVYTINAAAAAIPAKNALVNGRGRGNLNVLEVSNAASGTKPTATMALSLANKPSNTERKTLGTNSPSEIRRA